MKTYICLICGYKTKKDKKPESCNYCGKKGVMKEEEDIEEILNSS